MKIRDLDIDEFKALIHEAVEEKLEEILGDPDEGLELRVEIKKRLHRSMAATATGTRGVPVERVAKELGLEW